MSDRGRKSLPAAALWLWACAAAAAGDAAKPVIEVPKVNAGSSPAPAMKPAVLNLKPMALGSGLSAPVKAPAAAPTLQTAIPASPQAPRKTPEAPEGASGIQSLDAPLQKLRTANKEEAAGAEGAIERSLNQIFDAEKTPTRPGFSPAAGSAEAPLANENNVVVHAPRKRALAALGYRFYHATPLGVDAYPVQDEEFAVEIFKNKGDAGLDVLKKRVGVFNALVEDNFAALELISKNSNRMTVKTARQIHRKVGSMVSAYRELGGMSAAGSFLLAHDRLGVELEKSLAGLGEQDMIGVKAFEMIVPIEKDSLHRYINLIHQGALAEVGRTASSYGANMYLKFEKRGTDQFLKLMDLSEKPTVSQGRLLSPALKALAGALRGIHDTPTGSMILQDHQSWGHFKLGSHSAEVYANFLPPDEGGMIRIRYMEYAKGETNRARLYYIEKVLENLGFAVKADNQFLTAVIDKDHQAQSVDRMVETYRLVLLAFHATKGLDFALPKIMRESIKGVDDWAAIAAAEGGLPFFAHDRDQEMLQGYRDYKARDLKRGDLRVSLNRVLQNFGLPEIPASAHMGQRAIDRFFNAPIEEAIARGELRLSPGADAVKNASYDPLAALAYQASARPEESARMAQALGSLDPELFEFEALGTLGGFSAQRAQRKLDSGDWLILYVLRDPGSNQIAFARAERGSLELIPELLSPQSVFRLLERQGIAVSAFDPGASPGGLEIYRERLASPPAQALVSGVSFNGLAVSPGQGRALAARVTYDKAKAASGGFIFIAPYTTPDDLEAIRNARAVLTTSGGSLSHAAITTRELGVPAVILHQAFWSGDTAALEAAVYGMPRQTHGIAARDIESKKTIPLREGDVVRVDPAAGTVEVFASENQTALLTAFEDLEAYDAGRRAEVLGRWVERFKSQDIGSSPKTALARELLSGLAARSSFSAQAVEDVRRLRSILGAEGTPGPASMEMEIFAAEESAVQADFKAALELLEQADSAQTVSVVQMRASTRLDRLKMLASALEVPGDLTGPAAGAYSRILERTRGRVEEILSEGFAEIEKHARRYPEVTPEILPRINALIAQAKRRGLPAKFYEPWQSAARRLEAERAGLRDAAPAAALPLSEILDMDAPWVGGKAAKLGEIQKVVRAAGGSVPDAVALTVHAYRKFLKNAGIEGEIERVGADAKLSVEERSARIRRLILDAPLNAYEGVGLEIVRAVHAQGLTHTPLAVRSSAVDEDGADAAFAGAGDTHLYVDNAGLIKHVKQVWASLWNPRALFYRRAKGLSLALLNQAVVIQAMAASEVSGVAFTRDPVTGHAGRLIVNAAFGLGEGIVSGRVSPDQYALDKDDGREILPAIVSDKKLEIVRRPDGTGVVEKRVAAARRRARSLSPAQLKKLNTVAVALERHFGYGLDIEFSFVGQDLFILQARPITSGASARGPPR